MVKAVQFNLTVSAVLGTLLLVGCAHSARELPPDMSALAPSHRLLPGDTASSEYSMSCPELKAELASTRTALSRTETHLQGTQTENQVKGIAGLLIFTPVMLAMEDNGTMKTQYLELDVKRERLMRIAQARQCSLE